jgi:DNA topoisomerase-1
VIKFGKKILRVSKKADDKKYSADELATIPLDEVKKMITAQMPNAFAKKAAKKAPAKRAKPAAGPKKKAPAKTGKKDKK